MSLQLADSHFGLNPSRAISLNTCTPRADAKYVLVWLQQALRGAANPVIEYALAHANACGLPVLVYHGIREDYPHASTRLHMFLLQASRRLAQQCRLRGLRVVHYVQRPGHQERGLVYRLADDAAAVYTDEQFSFVGSWQARRLAESNISPVFAVDASRLVPTRCMPEGLLSTREFRAAHAALRAEWSLQAPDIAPCTGPYQGVLPLGLDALEHADDAALAQMAAACQIDHSLPASVQHPATSHALNARLEALPRVAQRYAYTRNNPALAEGTSGLSPYLHFGLVSPQEVLGAVQQENKSAIWKFLDELLTWREFAHYRARLNPDLHRYTSLPEDLRDDLQAHADDDRGELPSWEQLVHGETPDAVWNAAQRQWLATGWMHNNLRMVWSTQLLRMTAHPSIAWALGCYLNDRLSLDGRDPATYASLRWAFGEGARASKRLIYGRAPRKSYNALMRREGVKAWIEQANRVDVPRIDCSRLPAALAQYQ